MGPALSHVQARCLRRVDSGFCHSSTKAALSSDLREAAAELVALGLLRVERRRGRFPKRYVVTNAGVWALGTFASTSDRFDAEVREARASALRARVRVDPSSVERVRRAMSATAAPPSSRKKTA